MSLFFSLRATSSSARIASKDILRFKYNNNNYFLFKTSRSLSTMASNTLKPAHDFVDFVNASPTRRFPREQHLDSDVETVM